MLARCHVDLSEEQQAYDILKPIVDDHIENIALQRLFAEVCHALVRNNEELESLKRVLFYRPSDNEVFHRVKELENDSSPMIEKKFDDNFDSWEQLSSIDFGLIDQELSKEESTIVDKTYEKTGSNGSSDLMSYFDSKVINNEPSESQPMESFLMEKTMEKVTHHDDTLEHMIEVADKFINELIGRNKKNKELDVVA